ncbi:methyltransferase domain-containing protein [Yanghanlia caeni]|uniref:Class I SAM-dependent methyltransferase n=1 Tax=Yanghanlia caeni TaxID=3064283 RepID=A0ABU1D3Y4_9BURK|nr:class I SAM-dependent methyltransferase [Alcaligenaceae bacterium LG-2]NGR08257.1 class I SAM-dependent methyltransferase [bacterium SGD-2]HZH57104.1 class I SAM-dependent methyltransferase [Burkholderiaceae bacterium]
MEHERVEQPLILELEEWLDTPQGRYVAAWETAQFSGMVANAFGYHAIQIGLPHWNLLQANRIPYKACTSIVQTPEPPHALVVAEPENLPFDSQSIDLLILPHGLECASNPHQVLREIERVLVPEGRVVISGFNPWSLWGARGRLPGLDPLVPVPSPLQVSLPRLKDWFKLLSFELDRGRFGCYAVPSFSEAWLARWAFMEKAGDRWWPVCGAVYVVSAVKRVAGPRLVGPAWKRSRRARRMAAVATGRQFNTSQREIGK